MPHVRRTDRGRYGPGGDQGGEARRTPLGGGGRAGTVERVGQARCWDRWRGRPATVAAGAAEHGAGVEDQGAGHAVDGELALVAGEQGVEAAEVGHGVPERPGPARRGRLRVGASVGVALGQELQLAVGAGPHPDHAVGDDLGSARGELEGDEVADVDLGGVDRLGDDQGAGRVGRAIDPVSTVYGSAPARRGTASVAASTPAAMMTSQATTWTRAERLRRPRRAVLVRRSSDGQAWASSAGRGHAPGLGCSVVALVRM